LAEEAVQLKDLDQEALEQSLSNLNEDLGLVEGDADIARVNSRIVIVKAKLSAITGKTIL